MQSELQRYECENVNNYAFILMLPPALFKQQMHQKAIEEDDVQWAFSVMLNKFESNYIDIFTP